VGLLAATFAVACLVVAIAGLRVIVADPRIGSLTDELHPGGGRQRRSMVAVAYATLGRWSGPSIVRLLGPSWRRWVTHYLAAAGQPRGYDVAGFAEFQGAYATLAAIAAVLLLVQGRSGMALIVAALLMAYPSVWLFSEAQRRQRQIERDLPDFLDILAVTVSAGLSFRQALDRVGETLIGPLAEEMRRTLRRMDVGVARRQAFTELRDRNPRSTTMGLFTTAILQAEELGAPLADTLNQLARDMRREFSQQTRRRAARAAPRVSLIITVVILPAIVMLIVVALILGSDMDLGAL
jgi:tight adherence protein C